MATDVSLSDGLVFAIVALARLLLPLLIPRYPLPGIVAALVLDGLDQSIFQQFTALPLDGYQGYDKALDIYYLAIAYISTLCNWEDRFAFQLSRFLFYWRLAGVALFEVTQFRPLLLFFPNTFEYFFIFYEVCRLRWGPGRLGKGWLIGAAAAIWVFVKLPQEYWIHIAQLDTTDWLKMNLFGAAADASWGEALAGRPGVAVAAGVLAAGLAAGLVFGLRWALRRLPPSDCAPVFRAEGRRPPADAERARQADEEEARLIFDAALAEKVVLVGLVGLSFAHVLPRVAGSDLRLVIGLALIVTVNTVLSHWRARRGWGWRLMPGRYLLLAALNTGLVLLMALPGPGAGWGWGLASALFFGLLLTLLVMLFDQYRQVYLIRFG